MPGAKEPPPKPKPDGTRTLQDIAEEILKKHADDEGGK